MTESNESIEPNKDGCIDLEDHTIPINNLDFRPAEGALMPFTQEQLLAAEQMKRLLCECHQLAQDNKIGFAAIAESDSTTVIKLASVHDGSPGEIDHIGSILAPQAVDLSNVLRAFEYVQAKLNKKIQEISSDPLKAILGAFNER